MAVEVTHTVAVARLRMAQDLSIAALRTIDDSSRVHTHPHRFFL
jgi:hypothetical protein